MDIGTLLPERDRVAGITLSEMDEEFDLACESCLDYLVDLEALALVTIEESHHWLTMLNDRQA